MSSSTFKEPEPPCMTIGCGDNLSRQIGAEKRALLFNKSTRILNSTPGRRVVSRPQKISSFLSPSGTQTPNRLNKCKKSASLEDLTPKRETGVKERRQRPLNIPYPKHIFSPIKLPTQDEDHKKTSLAAKRVCHVLMLNAWRCRRRDAVELAFQTEQLETQVENLNIQTIVLRKLLDSEKERVTHATTEVQHMLTQVEESHRERNSIKTEKEQLEKEITRLGTCVCEMQTKCQNLKNDFLAARAEITVLETQMTKERDKISKLREDKKHLLEKVQTTEELVASKNATIDFLETSCRDLENQLASQVQIYNLAEMENINNRKKVQQLGEQQIKLSEELNEMRDLSKDLAKQIHNLQGVLLSKNKEHNALENKLEEQGMEIQTLQLKIIDRSEMQNSWRFQALQIAKTLARVPLSIFLQHGVHVHASQKSLIYNLLYLSL